MKSIKSKIIEEIKLEESKINPKENESTLPNQYMRKFWNDIEKSYFPVNSMKSLNEIIHLINSSFQHEKNNPLHIAKLFGINIYIDHNSQLQHKNSKGEDISEEIHILYDTLIKLENLNNKALTKIKELIPKVEANYESKKFINIEERRHILIDQIFDLEMKQLSESVQRVQFDHINQIYKISFDVHEKINSPLTFSKDDYNSLMNNRDFLNNICIYDLFQEKIHSYYTQNTDDFKTNSNNTPEKNDENYSVAEKIQIDDYAYCHHCKQRKPLEVMVQCKSSWIKGFKSQRPVKRVIINGTAYIKRNQSIIVKNYTSGSEEFLDAIHDNEEKYRCTRYFCHFCLKGSYDAIIEEIKDKKDWICPYCTGQCFCSRCLRSDKILKLIAYYISIGGDINELYDSLVNGSQICDKLNEYLILTNVIIVNNDKIHTPKELVNDMFKEEINNSNIENDEQNNNNGQGLQFKVDEYEHVYQIAQLTKDVLEELNKDLENIFYRNSEDKKSISLIYQNFKDNKIINGDDLMIDKGEFSWMKKLKSDLKKLTKIYKGKNIDKILKDYNHYTNYSENSINLNNTNNLESSENEEKFENIIDRHVKRIRKKKKIKIMKAKKRNIIKKKYKKKTK